MKMREIEMSDNGFSLIELMIVIAIIGILVAVALPKFTDMIREAKYTKARQDCDTLVHAIQKFNSLEATTVQERYMEELKGRYVTAIDTLKDPWGNRYEQDYKKGVVYSKGADGKHKDGGGNLASENKDDICVIYAGALVLVGAKLEVNPLHGNFLDPNEAGSCYDVLHLYFNKEVALPAGGVNLKACAKASAPSGTSDPEADALAVFRYYVSANRKTAPIIPGADDLLDLPEIPDENISFGSDSKEITLRMPAGYTSADPAKKLLIPGTHYINLTGAKNNRNRKFLETGGANYAIDGAEASGCQMAITNYD